MKVRLVLVAALMVLMAVSLWAQPTNAALAPDPPYATLGTVEITEDQTVSLNGGVYTKTGAGLATLTAAENGAGISYRSYVDFDITSIPDNATTTKVEFRFKIFETTAATEKGRFYPMTATGASQSAQNAFTDARDGAMYVETAASLTTSTFYTYNLGAAACTDLQALLAANWFSLGFSSAGVTTSTIQINSEDAGAGNTPSLYVYYYYTLIHYTFNVKWENGTATTTSVTAISSDGTETFTASTGTTVGFTLRPTAFTWAPSAGLTRLIYPLEDSATYTIMMPVGTPTVYSFTFRDYVGIIGNSDS